MSAVFPTSITPSAPPRASVPASGLRPLASRIALLATCLGAGLASAALADPAAMAGVEPELVLLLRGMAVLKAGLALAAVALAFWRFGRPVSLLSAAGYVVGVSTLVAASVLIWFLSFIAGAAIAFHVGALGLLVLAWRDGRTAMRDA